MIKAGQMKLRAWIEKPVRHVDANGTPYTTWAKVRCVRCSLKAIRGSLVEAMSKVSEESSHVIRMRYFADITSENQIEIDGRIFSIDYVDNIQNLNRELELAVHEVVT
jgi:SPP1 family predicted phage head-tail adaptor